MSAYDENYPVLYKEIFYRRRANKASEEECPACGSI
jgi:hypothetical protein